LAPPFAGRLVELVYFSFEFKVRREKFSKEIPRFLLWLGIRSETHQEVPVTTPFWFKDSFCSFY